MKVCKDVKKEFGNEYHTVTRMGSHNWNKTHSLTSNMNVCILLKFVVGMTISFNVILYIDIRNGMNSRNQQNLPA